MNLMRIFSAKPFPALTCLSVALVFLLVACSGEVYDRAYTASGDGFEEADLNEDAQFTGDDDFNVVVKLNPHTETVTVRARFIDPNGDLLQEAEAEAGSGVGTVILGVDYERRADAGANQWARGRYTVEIYIDDERVDRLFFRVD